MSFCDVSGCASNSDSSDSSTSHTFHPLPSSLIPRTQWILALGPLPDDSYVCSRHFDESMFTNDGNVKMLIPNAVPKQFLHSSPNDEPTSNLRECSNEAGSSDEMVACRACLAVDGRLYAIRGSGLEDALAGLTGIAVSVEDSLPRHLCAFCMAKLSKCAGFRDSCQRSTALLQSLLKKGPLKMNAIKALNRKSQQLINNLTCNKVFQFGTEAFIEIMPLIKTENNESSHEIAKCAEVECIESENFIKKDASDLDICAFGISIEKRERPSKVVQSRPKNIECVKVEVEIKNSNAHSDIDDYIESEVEDYTSNIDTDASEETLATVKKRKITRVTLIKENKAKQPRKKGKLKTEVDKHSTNINTDIPEPTTGLRNRVEMKSSGKESAIEKKNNRKTKLLSTEEQKQKVKKRKRKNNSVYICDLCGKLYKTENNFKAHKTRHDPNLSKEALATLKKDADLDFEKEYNFEIKILSKEEQKQRIEERKNNMSQYSCNMCGKGHNTESNLTAHMTSYHNQSFPLECDVCFYRFRSWQDLRKHQHEDRHRAVFTCNECGHVTSNRIYAKDHCLMHRGKKYSCPHCEMTYDRQASYYGHIRLQHPGQNEACDQCGETFTGKVGLLVHKRLRHKNDKQNEDLKCKDCDVTFSSPEALQRHLELSAGVPHAALWPCAACGDSCGSETARDKHAADKHPPEQHYCKECNKAFSDATSFALHVDRKHKNRRANNVRVRRRRVVCELCGKFFTCLATLQYHMNVHLGLKPYQCPHCPKAFSHKTKQKLHMRIHTGERRYQCEQCPMAFTARGNFTRHITNVHMRVQVKCDTCGKTMGAGSLALHMRAVHMNQPPVRRKRNRTNKTQHRVSES